MGLKGPGGAVEHGEEVLDAEEEAARVVESVVHGWPAVSSEPVPAADVGRFVRAHPLEFPMGIADLYDPRVRAVTPQEWAQHLLRYHTGQFVCGLRGHRVVWAIVNAVLEFFAVQRNVMRRMGCRMVGQVGEEARQLGQDFVEVLDSQLPFQLRLRHPSSERGRASGGRGAGVAR